MSKWRARALDVFPEMRAEIESAESVGRLWIELISRLHGHYSSAQHATPRESPDLFRAICLYAIWCVGSDSLETQQAAGIEFYFYLPRFALQSPDSVYRRFIRELVTNMPMAEIEKMGGSLKPSDLKRFLADVRQADEERQRRSRKR
jgi:hypothetical protein